MHGVTIPTKNINTVHVATYAQVLMYVRTYHEEINFDIEITFLFISIRASLVSSVFFRGKGAMVILKGRSVRIISQT